MRSDAAILLGSSFIAALMAVSDVEAVNGLAAGVVALAGAATAFLFSLAHGPKTEVAMANGDAQEVEVEGFGIKGKARGRRIITDNVVILLSACALVFALYKHHTANEEALTRIYEAMAENTYVLSLSQADRERLQIAMPESLRRKTLR